MRSLPTSRRNKPLPNALYRVSRVVRIFLAGLLVWLMALGVVANRAIYVAISDADAVTQAPLQAEDAQTAGMADGDNESPVGSGDDADPSGDDDDDNVETDELCDRDLPMVAPRIGRSAWLVFETDSARQAVLRAPEKFPSAS